MSMKRRRFVQLAFGWLASPRVVTAQQSQRVFRVGWLQLDQTREASNSEMFVTALRQALKARGYVDGINMTLDNRSLIGSRATAVEAIEDLIRKQTDVLVLRTALEAAIAKDVTKTMPIVFVAISDPVGFKLVESLARPGGNITGMSYVGIELNTKRLELLKQTVPGAARIALLGDSRHVLLAQTVADLRVAAQRLRVELVVFAIKSPDELDGTFAAIARADASAVLGLQSPIFGPHRDRVARLALKHRLPAIFEPRMVAEAGALMAYGPDNAELFSRVAYYVDRILKGAKPAELPVEQTTKFALTINMKTARALGVTVPPALFVSADLIDP
jgi:putative ABC transport system substrate-binding protein